MVAAVQLMHNVIADETGDSGQVCFWASSSSGVACTATMPSPTTSPLTVVTSALPTGTVGTAYTYIDGGVFAAGGTPATLRHYTGRSSQRSEARSHDGIISGVP